MDVVDLETGEIVLEALFQQIPLLTPDEAKQAVTYFGRDGKSLVYASIRDLERDLLTCPVATNKLANFVKSNAFRNLKTHQELTNIRISLRRAIVTMRLTCTLKILPSRTNGYAKTVPSAVELVDKHFYIGLVFPAYDAMIACISLGRHSIVLT